MVPAMPSDCWNDSRVVSERLDPERVDHLEAVRAVRRQPVCSRSTPTTPAPRALAGVEVVSDLPRTEWFVTLADDAASARLDGEVAVTSALADPPAARRRCHRRRDDQRRLRPPRRRSPSGASAPAASSSPASPTSPHFDDTRRSSRSSADSCTPSHRHARTDLGVGVVGYGPFGGMGYLHGLASTETDGLALVAAADSAPERIVAARADFPDLVGHDSVDSLAADPAVDIAIIATPPVLHAELALAVAARRQARRDREADVPAARGCRRDHRHRRRPRLDASPCTRAVDGIATGSRSARSRDEATSARCSTSRRSSAASSTPAAPGTPRSRSRVARSTTGVRTTSTGSSSSTARPRAVSCAAPTPGSGTTRRTPTS